MKKYQNIIVGSGFSSGLTSMLIKSQHTIITSNYKILENCKNIRRKNLENHFKFKKIKSFGNLNFITKKILLHDLNIFGGNSIIWGGLTNIDKINSKLFSYLKSIFFFQDLSYFSTGSKSNNNNLKQICHAKKKLDIFSSENIIKKNFIIGHITKIICNKQSIKLNFINEKHEEKTIQCKKLFLGINFVQLVELLVNSKIIKNKDIITLEEHAFKETFGLFLNFKKNNNLQIIYSFYGIIKHFIGYQKKFNDLLIFLLNLVPLNFRQEFLRKTYVIKFIYKKEINSLVVKKSIKDFGKSIHYYNMKINNIKVFNVLNNINKNIHGISSPFIKSKQPGPISNQIMNNIKNILN
jgi:hypothetical protein